MTARISLICHGATAGHKLSAFPADEPLDARARKRSPQLKQHLLRADRILVGPSMRTRQTAEILDLEAVVDPALRECDYGRWAGVPISVIGEKEPESLMLWAADLSSAPHGGEPLSAVLARAATWLDQNLKAKGHIILVTHALLSGRACCTYCRPRMQLSGRSMSHR